MICNIQYQDSLFVSAELNQNMTSNHWPSSNIVAVPVGVEVDTVHAPVLFRALLGVEVVFSKYNTPSPGPVDAQNKDRFLLFHSPDTLTRHLR